jgi:hypothetical protein
LLSLRAPVTRSTEGKPAAIERRQHQAVLLPR